MSQTTYAGWPLIEIQGIGPDGTCHCPRGRECKSAGKHPRETAWQEGGELDVAATVRKRPRANLGTLTGEPAGFWVLDIDPEGMDAMQALIAKHGLLPNTRVHRTGGGTYHYFFKMPDFDVTNRRGSLPKGVDARGTGGQVVLPPSVSSKGPYEVVRDAEILMAPDWIHEMIRPKDAEVIDFPTPVEVERFEPGEFAHAMLKDERLAHEQTPREAKYERSIIDGEIERLQAMTKAATPDGTGYEGDPWDTTTYMAACQLFELANAGWTTITPEEVETIVMSEAPRDNGFTDARVKEKITSARAKVGTKARPAPVDNTSWMDEVEAAQPPTSPQATPTQKVKPGTKHKPADFFNKDGLRARDLANAVMAEAPIRWGQNQRWWSYDPSGVWVEDRYAVRNRCIDILGNRYRSAHSSNVEAIVQRYSDYLEIDTPDETKINFRNGMLDWGTGKMAPHAPEDASTVQIPHHYEPDAECPRFDAFLESVMSPDYQHLVWEMIGYLLFSGNKLQVAFLLHGSGGDGKGTLIKVITAMLGKQNIAQQSLDSLNGDKFAAANLFGKIANIAGDIDATFQESTARFKMLTGEDRFPGEYKYGDSFGFDNYAVPVFSANKIPGSADVSKGYLRRWINIEFDRKFEGDPIAGLGASLAATEVPGVIAKGLRYLGPLLKRGHFHVEGEALQGRDDFHTSIDQAKQWVDQRSMPVDNGPVKQDLLYEDYRWWAGRNGVRQLRASEFYDRLEGMGVRRTKSRGTRYFHGISLLPEEGDKTLKLTGNTDWFDEKGD